MSAADAEETYYPPPESEGGWRYTVEPDAVRSLGGMDPENLDLVAQMEELLFAGHSWAITIIRRGYLVRELYTFNVQIPSRFDIWSGTKSFTGTAWGMLLEDSRQGKPLGGRQVYLDSPAYDFIPDGHPLSDPRKKDITIRHLLTMTSSIPGERQGVVCSPTQTGYGPFEYALGRCPNRYGKWVDKLAAEPGERWDYSDPAFMHLALAFANIAGQELSDYLKERVFDPIGIENLSWDVQGGSGFMGPHTNAHRGIHISARELARFGYLMLRNGVWEGRQLIRPWWIELSTKTSQELNPNYGYTWWVNTHGTMWPGMPQDTFALRGFRANKCYIIPSLDLVIARVGTGPVSWNDPGLLNGVVNAVLPGQEGERTST
jgi:CubicO group peptidase (beta-lactamase class C family)